MLFVPSKKRIAAWILVPPVLVGAVAVCVILYLGGDFLARTGLFFIAGVFIFLLLCQAYILERKIIPYLKMAVDLSEASSMQEKSARLLVRRDLELNKANEQLRKLDARKSEFVSIVAHQLRTPLSGIKWILNMLISGELGALGIEQKTFLMKGYESNERMISLVDDMLRADRIESGRDHYRFISTDIVGLVDNVLLDIFSEAYSRHIKIEFHKPTEALPTVQVDQEKMRGVLQNILENAIKYTSGHGTVTISLSRDSSSLTLAVADTGIGIPKEEQKYIFNQFFRASNAIKIQTDGSGLGLFIARSIIESHRGTISFESQEGKGTTFYIRLRCSG